MNPRRVALILFCTVAALVAASTAGQAVVHLTGHDFVFGFVHRFSLVEEANVPAWYSSVALLACAALLPAEQPRAAPDGCRARHQVALGRE